MFYAKMVLCANSGKYELGFNIIGIQLIMPLEMELILCDSTDYRESHIFLIYRSCLV